MAAHDNDVILISPDEMKAVMYQILIDRHVPQDKATTCVEVFTSNSVDGVYTHGVNRFSRFVEYIDKGLILPAEEPSCVDRLSAMEQWDGRSAIGITNAIHCTRRSMELATTSGIGCVAIRNTNHWMRAGTYARLAAAQGYAFIAWTNTIANTPAWGAVDARLGNNPIVFGIPFGDDAIVMDTAMSQYSYGSLEQYRLKKETLPFPGGYDETGNLSVDPLAILKSRRTLPIGYWKGSGLSFLLDILAAILSGGKSVADITRNVDETKVSQVFIAFDLKSLSNFPTIQQKLVDIVDDLHASLAIDDKHPVRYPGERIMTTRKENLQKGIPVHSKVWKRIADLKS
jgi:3-dehydro-L-gulonate 2-dehydrogenase